MPVPTVEEILKQTGLSADDIKGLDPKITSGLTQVLTVAGQESANALAAREAAEKAQRSVSEKWDKEINPALDAWGVEKANKDAEIAFYKTQLEGAKAGGFLAADAPITPGTPAKGPDGKFVANGNTVPGSPGVDAQKIREEIGSAFSFAADVQWKYQQLFGKQMPDSPTTLIKEAQEARMPAGQYAAKKYDFAGREAAVKAEDQKKHDDAIRAEVSAAKDKEWSEKTGSNPGVRRSEESRFSEIRAAEKAGKRPDPLMMTEAQRNRSTRDAIRSDIAVQETGNA